MMIHTPENIDSRIINIILSISPKKFFKNIFVIFYQDHIPNFAIYLQKGRAKIILNDKTIHQISAPAIIGLKELLLSSPVEHKVIIEAGAWGCPVDRPTLQKALKNERFNINLEEL